MEWTLLVDPEGERGATNMGIDASLMEQARRGHGFLRLYGWAPPCLSFGRNEPAARRYDREAIRRLGIDTVRRPTGGRAVWHDREVTYAVAAPAGTFGTLRETYRAIHATIAKALRRLGVDARLAEAAGTPPLPLSAGACFAAPVGGEVVVGGLKLVGSAQCRDDRTFLQHGSILLANGQDLVARVSRKEAPHIPATSLVDILSRPVHFPEVAAAVADEARETWPGRWRTGRSSTFEIEPDRFRDTGWTWRR